MRSLLIFLITAICLNNNSTAQTRKKVKAGHEIALNVTKFGEMNLSFWGDIPNTNFNWEPQTYIGLQYWYRSTKNITGRFGFNYVNIEKTTQLIRLRPGSQTENTTGFNFDIGIQNSKTHTQNVYSFIELNSFIGERKFSFNNLQLLEPRYTAPEKIRNIGLAYGLGFKIPIVQNISLNIESKIRLYPKQNRSNAVMIEFNPISRFSLNYRFKQKKSSNVYSNFD